MQLMLFVLFPVNHASSLSLGMVSSCYKSISHVQLPCPCTVLYSSPMSNYPVPVLFCTHIPCPITSSLYYSVLNSHVQLPCPCTVLYSSPMSKYLVPVLFCTRYPGLLSLLYLSLCHLVTAVETSSSCDIAAFIFGGKCYKIFYGQTVFSLFLSFSFSFHYPLFLKSSLNCLLLPIPPPLAVPVYIIFYQML